MNDDDYDYDELEFWERIYMLAVENGRAAPAAVANIAIADRREFIGIPNEESDI